MRRARGTRGRGANPPRRHPPPMQPYISDEIQNINMELQLLKQKKDMIEKQQYMLEGFRNYNQFQNEYEPQSYFDDIAYDSAGPSRPRRNFSYADDDPYATQEYIPFKRSRKRPAERWANEPPPKRFTGAGRGGARRQHPTASRKNPKPEVFLPPKKRASKGAMEEFTLRANREPSVKLGGRLEFALGDILKQMKERFADDEKLTKILTTQPYLSILKPKIRNRIRTVMMNKTVERGEQVTIEYRERFPTDGDTLFLKKVSREIAGMSSTADILKEHVISAPMNPTNFRKNELPLIIDAELDEIFRKLEIMYDRELTEEQKAKKLATNQIDATLDEEFVPEEEKTEEIKLWKKTTREKVHKIVPKVLLRSVNHITKLLKLDLMYVNTTTAIVNKAGDTDDFEIGLPEANTGMPRFCVRVRGIPKLPTTTVMRPFIGQFNPIWVKKNRMVRNLLFIAFRDQESLNKMLEKNGFDFGNCFLKISKLDNKPKQGKKKNTNKHPNPVSKPGELDMSANLNDQIDDLLLSIRHAEEEIAAEPGEETETVPKENIKEERDVKETENGEKVNVPAEGINVNEPQNKDKDVPENGTGSSEQNSDASKSDKQGDKDQVDNEAKNEKTENAEKPAAEVNE